MCGEKKYQDFHVLPTMADEDVLRKQLSLNVASKQLIIRGRLLLNMDVH